MKAFLAAVFAVAFIGASSWAIFGRTMQETSEAAFSTPAVRLPEHH